MSSVSSGLRRLVGIGPTIRERLFEAAEVRDFELDPKRAYKLNKRFRGSNPPKHFSLFGLSIYDADWDDDTLNNSTSIIDFLPALNNDDLPKMEPRRDKITEATLLGIGALQCFVLAADIGLVSTPEKIRGETNPSMAKVAERVGFERIYTYYDEDAIIAADYDVIVDRVFSPEILGIQQRFEERMSKLGRALIY